MYVRPPLQDIVPSYDTELNVMSTSSLIKAAAKKSSGRGYLRQARLVQKLCVDEQSAVAAHSLAQGTRVVEICSACCFDLLI